MNNLEKICPICEKGELVPSTHTSTFDYHGNDIVVDDLEVSVCDLCKSELVFPEQNKINRIKVADQKRRFDGLLISNEIVALRKKYDLTQIQASKMFGGGTNAFSKYERGDVIQSIPMDRLLRLVNADPLLLLQLAGIAGFETETQKGEQVICDYNDYIEYFEDDTFFAEQEIKVASVEKRTKVIETKIEWEEVA